MTNGREPIGPAVPSWVYTVTPPTDDEPWPAPRELYESRGTWLGIAMLAVAFAAGLAVGWALR